MVVKGLDAGAYWGYHAARKECGGKPFLRIRKTNSAVDMGLELVRELLEFAREHKAWWLVPLFVMLLVVGVLIIVSQSAVVSTFIYSIF